MIPSIRKQMPLVFNIITEAENKIKAETGVEVKLKLVTSTQAAIENRLDLLLKTMCALWGNNITDIRGQIRTREFVIPRQMFCFVAHRLYGDTTSLKTIGSTVNYKDHTTVLNAINQICDLLASRNEQVLSFYNKVKHLLDEEKV
jgi:chromosomal replication initiation ATPase DnaA